MLNLPEKIRLSRWARVVEQKVNPEKPMVVLAHGLSGNSLRVSRATVDFVQSLPESISRKELLRRVDSKSQGPLRLLAEKKLLVDANLADEFSLFLDQYPLWSLGILASQSEGELLFLAVGSERELKLSGWEKEFVLRCDGRRTLRVLQKECNQSVDSLRILLEKLTQPDFQLLRISSVSVDAPEFRNGEGIDFFVTDWAHSAEVLKAKELARKGGTVDLEEFHQHGISDAFAEFNEVEITLAHAFREPNIALGGFSYGGAFFETLWRWRSILPGAKVVEVGGGTGIFAREMRRAAKRKGLVLDYTIVDLSPALQASQKKINAEFPTQYVLQNAERLKLPKKSVDLLVSNEVIADFRAVKLKKSDLKKRQLSGNAGKALAFIKKYELQLQDAPEEFYFNFGAALFLERIQAVLAPGGTAVITEFGDFAYPTATHHLNHDEYSIHWGHMLQLAHALGLKATLQDMGSLVPFNHHIEMFSGDIFELNRILRKHNRKELEPRAYAREELEILLAPHADLRIHGLRYAPFYEETYWGPSLSDFQALIVRK